MIISHIGLWCKDIELLKEFYVQNFDAIVGTKYINSLTGFESYFLKFESGTSLELMTKPELIGFSRIDNSTLLGFAHLAFNVDNMKTVDQKAKNLEDLGFKIHSGPRKTGDGYYEFETSDPEGNRIEVTSPCKDTI